MISMSYGQAFRSVRRLTPPFLRAGSSRAILVLAAAAAMSAGAHLPAVASVLPCTPPEGVARLAGPTPALLEALKANDEIKIVAFGSSSTEGTGASARERTYPARMAAALRRVLPGRRFKVINRGKGGELASDMLRRLERDVIAEEPALAIWQTGVNDAIRGIDMDDFRATVEEGISRLKERGVDVILLDAQYYPRSQNVSTYRDYVALMRKIGAAHDVPVFRRYQLMTHLVESGQFKVEELLAADRFHQNDTSYHCLGAVIAEAIRVRFDSTLAPAFAHDE